MRNASNSVTTSVRFANGSGGRRRRSRMKNASSPAAKCASGRRFSGSTWHCPGANSSVTTRGSRLLALVERDYLRFLRPRLRPRLNRHLADALVAHAHDEPWAVVAVLDIVAQADAEADASRRIGRREVAADDVVAPMMIAHTSSVAHRHEGGVATMPVERCQRDGKPGYRWGKTGYC